MLAVIFQVANARYAMRCRNIVEVIPRVALRPLPQAPPWLSGVFAYRGGLSPVVDLCALIGGYACPARLSSRIILVRCEFPAGTPVVAGFLAEYMTEARQLKATPLSGPHQSLAPYLGDMVQEDGGLVQLIDETAILGSAGPLLQAPTFHDGAA